ncbi:MAG: pyridoxal phosphate-dependent aminotransferase [Bacillota bacterium]|nr:pyridoxal phosphate-dependent aminotransferase [Bacillota bacterium]
MFSKEMYELGNTRSAIRELFEYGKLRADIVGKENVFDFSIGNPSVPAPECIHGAIEEIFQNEDSCSIHGYTSAQGDLSVRQGLADYMSSKYSVQLRADNFYMTCGAAASLSICFRALTESKKDEFISIAPYFPEYKVFVEAAGAGFRVVPPDMRQFQINFSELEKTINENTKAIIINSPNNPSGAVYSAATIQNLCDLLKLKSSEYKHPIFIISDEPYREIVYDRVVVPFIPKYYDNTIVCYSYSKALSLPGERIGYILVPDKAEKSREIYLAVCGAGRALGYVCAPSLFQKVILKCIGKTSNMDVYRTNRDLLYNKLTSLGYDCVKPEGAFYLFVKALESDAVAFCEKAKQLDLLLVPGDGFGCPGYVRISYCVAKAMIERSFKAFEKLKDAYIKE